MTYSLNEIETLCRKAARGAGYGWGLAEDAGRAVRWLEAQGCLGAQALAGLLEAVDGADPAAMTPRVGPVWQGTAPLCPITTGAALSDHAHLLDDGPITLGATRFPLLVLPFAAAVAGDGGVSVSWQGAGAVVGAGGSSTEGALGTEEVPGVAIARTGSPVPAHSPQTRCSLTPALVARLDAFARRTYAPATEASRLAGAGAGLTDND